MKQNGLNTHARPSSRHVAARTLRATSGAVAVTTIFGLLALTGTGCDGSDSTIAVGGAGGSGGSGGNGGSAGSAGSSGSGGGGAAGAAGAGGGSMGGAAGSAGSGGSAGSAGDGGSDGDAGVTDAGGDAASGALTRQQMAESICAAFAAIPECQAPDDCVNAQLGGMTFFEDGIPECTELVDAYYSCQANLPPSEFVCVEGSAGTDPEACQAELQAIFANQYSEECCPGCEE